MLLQFGDNQTMPERINVAIVGYGFAGKDFHAYLISLVPGLNLYGVMARKAEVRQRAQQDYPVKTFTTMDELLADDNVALIVLATPHETHASLAVRAMDAGKHVVTDKIMCLSVAEADAMIDAAKRNNVMLSVFHNRRWDGDYLTVKNALDEGLLGEPFIIESLVLRGMGYRPSDHPRFWRAQASHGGGHMRDWGAHLFDQAVQLVDSPAEWVFCTMQHRWPNSDVDDWVRAQIHFANGVDYFIEVGGLTTIPKPRWFVRGSKGTLVKTGVDPQEGAMLKGDIDASVEPPEDYARVQIEGEKEQRIIPTTPGRWRSYYENIADVLLTGAGLAVKPENVRRMIVLTEACARSAELGQVVKLKAE